MRYIAIALVLLLLALMEIAHANTEPNDSSTLLDINAASASTLAEELPGIGPAKAALIVQWREQNGLFKHIDQLQEVKGIGPKTVDRLRSLVKVGSEAAAKRMRMQQDKQEDKVQADVQQVFSNAVHASRPESIRSLPARPWYRKSMLGILRTH